jgi:hypothetical protein
VTASRSPNSAARRHVRCLAHQGSRRVEVAAQLEGVGAAGVRTGVRPHVDHALDRLVRLVVAAELDQRIADDSVTGRAVRVDGHRLLSIVEGGGEVVPGGGERTHSGQRGGVAVRAHRHRAA